MQKLSLGDKHTIVEEVDRRVSVQANVPGLDPVHCAGGVEETSRGEVETADVAAAVGTDVSCNDAGDLIGVGVDLHLVVRARTVVVLEQVVLDGQSYLSLCRKPRRRRRDLDTLPCVVLEGAIEDLNGVRRRC